MLMRLGLTGKLFQKNYHPDTKTTSVLKVNKECVTIMMYANASGFHILQLIVTGKPKHSCFKDNNMNNFLINYLHKKCIDGC